MKSELSLLHPEWQGYGEDNAVYRGALKLAQSLFNTEDFTQIPVTPEENLKRLKRVLGLDSIVARFLETLHKLQFLAPRKIFMIGGTCGVEIAPVGYLNELYQGNLAVVWFDAHGDLNTPDSSPSGHFHGMALRTLLGEGPEELIGALKRFLVPEQIFLAGTRELDPPEAAYCSEKAISISPTSEFSKPHILVSRIRERGFTHLYLHLDLDVINPDSFPNSLMQTPGGPKVGEVQIMMKALSDNFDIVGFSIVEYCERGAEIEVLRNLVFHSGIKIGAIRDLH
jgi:arginase